MAPEAAKKTMKPKVGKPPAEAKEVKPEAPAAAVKKAAKPDASAKKSAAAGKVKVTQIQGCIARRWDQEATLKGLGLNKRHRSRVLEDTPAVRGMIYKVRHLVKVEQAG